MQMHTIDEFLDDTRFITEKQKEQYIVNKRFEGDSKKSVQLAFERYYESFKWLRKKKGQPMKFELGDARDKPIVNDMRHTRQTTEIALIIRQAIFNFMNKLDPENKHIKDGYYYTTSFPFLFELGLVDDSLKMFYEDYYKKEKWDEEAFQEEFSKEKVYSEDYFREIKEKENKKKQEKEKLFHKQYLDAKKKIWRELLGQVGNLPDMKENYIGKKYAMNCYYTTEPDLDGDVQTIYSSVLMTDEQIEKYEAWEQEMKKRDDVEKPKIFKKKNKKMERWEKLEKIFIDKEFNATQVYTKIGLKVNGSYGESKEVDLDYFREDFKYRSDKMIATNIINKAKYEMIWNIEHSGIIDQESINRLSDEFEEGTQQALDFELDKFDALDLKNGLGVRSKTTQEYIDLKKNEIRTIIHNKQDILEIDTASFIDEYLEKLLA